MHAGALARSLSTRKDFVAKGVTFGSEAEVFSFFGGGGLVAVSMASSGVVVIGGPVPGTVASLVCSGLAAGPAAVALAGLGGGHGAAAELVG